jgi:hypothetical protein
MNHGEAPLARRVSMADCPKPAIVHDRFWPGALAQIYAEPVLASRGVMDGSPRAGSLLLQPHHIRPPAGHAVEQPVDVGMFARMGPRIGGVFGVQLQPFGCGGGGDGAVALRQCGVDRHRAGLAGFVLNRGDHLTRGIEQLQAGEVGHRGQLLEGVGKGHGGWIGE